MKIQTLEDLSNLRCQCGCNEGVFLHSKCHPDAPTWAFVHPEGFLILSCCECKGVIMRIAIGELPAEGVKSHWLEYQHATQPDSIVEGFERDENECVAMLLMGIPDKGGSATKENFELLVRQAFQGGLLANQIRMAEAMVAVPGKTECPGCGMMNPIGEGCECGYYEP